jgi:hypothetical protein
MYFCFIQVILELHFESLTLRLLAYFVQQGTTVQVQGHDMNYHSGHEAWNIKPVDDGQNLDSKIDTVDSLEDDMSQLAIGGKDLDSSHYSAN